MLKPARYYIAGLAISLICLIAAELIWLPAPLRTAGGMQWIEMIDRLFYGVALVPLSFAVGAGVGLIIHWGKRGFMHLLLQFIRLIIVVLGLVGAGLILFAPQKLMLLLIVCVAAIPLLFVDMLLSEILIRIQARTGGGLNYTGRGGKRLSLLPWRSGSLLVVSVLLLLVFLCPTSYQVLYPGMTMNLNRYAHVEGGQSGGTVNGVLVFDRPAVTADWLYAKLFPNALYSFEKIPENQPPLTETYTQVVQMKTDANSVAAALAMQKAGIGKGITPNGVRVMAIVKDSPADKKLEAGDLIEKMDGHTIRSVGEMMAYMDQSVKPSQVVELALNRGGVEKKIEIKTAASSDAPERAIFGISIQTDVHMDIPRNIAYKYYMAHIGGPSHGAMLTLAFIDQLTPGGIIHGVKVAGTGTIEADGSIGLIGGIKQKAYAISRTDADVFFVPAELEQAARSGAPDLNIVPVENIDEVLDWLAQHGK